MRFYACEDKEGKPLGYVKAAIKIDAIAKGKEKFPTFYKCYLYNGVL